MTCIVGIAENGIVTMGGDSLIVGDYEKTISRESKVFRMHNVLLGTSGPTRMRNLLQHAKTIPPYPGGDPMGYLMNDFLEAVFNLFQEKKFAQEDKGQAIFDGRILVGLAGQLFTIGRDYNIAAPERPYSAIGSGDEYALGALFVLQHQGIPPRQRLEMALQAAAYHCMEVGEPFSFVSSDDLLKQTQIPELV